MPILALLLSVLVASFVAAAPGPAFGASPRENCQSDCGKARAICLDGCRTDPGDDPVVAEAMKGAMKSCQAACKQIYRDCAETCRGLPGPAKGDPGPPPPPPVADPTPAPVEAVADPEPIADEPPTSGDTLGSLFDGWSEDEARGGRGLVVLVLGSCCCVSAALGLVFLVIALARRGRGGGSSGGGPGAPPPGVPPGGNPFPPLS